MRYLLIALPLLLLQAPAAQAQVYVNIGIHLPVYPQLQRVPGYPVYYAPAAPGNYFFYDGLYWVFEDDFWYYSSWYNGPWIVMDPFYVPVYLLRVPVHYYRRPPVYFRYWRADAPPRWGEHWGPGWAQRRPGWDHWDRSKAPAPAPLPNYQRDYPQSRYPQAELQDRIRNDHYRYQPRSPEVRARLAAPPPASPRVQEREDVRRPDRPEQPAPRIDRSEPRAVERAAPPPSAMPRPQDREDGRRPERVERSEPRIDRSEPRGVERGGFERGPMPPMQRGEPEQRRPEQRAAPEPRAWPPSPPPQARPEPPPRQLQQQPPPPMQMPRAEPGNRGQERGPQGGGGQQRRWEEQERGRPNDRGERGNR